MLFRFVNVVNRQASASNIPLSAETLSLKLAIMLADVLNILFAQEIPMPIFIILIY